MKLPGKLQSMTAYTPVTGNYTVRLDANESFLPMPNRLGDRMAETLAQVPLHRYPDPEAAGVRRLAADLFGLNMEQIIAGNGSDELIGLIMAALVPHGGRVLLTDPDFSMYRFYAELHELACTAIGKPDRRPDVDAVLREAARQSPDLVIFSNPSNPSGLGASQKDVMRLLDGVDCPVVVDEAYMEFWDQSLIPDIPQYENLLILKTCSKAFGLAGLRLGFALGGPELIGALQKVRSPYNVNALTQAVGEVVLSEPAYLKDCVDTIKEATASMLDGLRDLTSQTGGRISVLPTETNFVLLKTPGAANLFDGLRNRGILVRQLGPELLRITAGSPEDQAILFAALEDILTNG